MVVPEVALRSLAADSVVLGTAAAGGVQLLFLFSTGCGPCEESSPAWNAITTTFEANPNVHVVGVSLDSADATRRYATDHQLTFPVVSLPDRRMQALWRARLLPQILVIDGLGRVQYARVGKLVGPAARDSVRDATDTAVAAAYAQLQAAGDGAGEVSSETRTSR